jgi:hypothetical protein
LKGLSKAIQHFLLKFSQTLELVLLSARLPLAAESSVPVLFTRGRQAAVFQVQNLSPPCLRGPMENAHALAK